MTEKPQSQNDKEREDFFDKLIHGGASPFKAIKRRTTLYNTMLDDAEIQGLVDELRKTNTGKGTRSLGRLWEHGGKKGDEKTKTILRDIANAGYTHAAAKGSRARAETVQTIHNWRDNERKLQGAQAAIDEIPKNIGKRAVSNMYVDKTSKAVAQREKAEIGTDKLGLRRRERKDEDPEPPALEDAKAAIARIPRNIARRGLADTYAKKASKAVALRGRKKKESKFDVVTGDASKIPGNPDDLAGQPAPWLLRHENDLKAAEAEKKEPQRKLKGTKRRAEPAGARPPHPGLQEKKTPVTTGAQKRRDALLAKKPHKYRGREKKLGHQKFEERTETGRRVYSLNSNDVSAAEDRFWAELALAKHQSQINGIPVAPVMQAPESKGDASKAPGLELPPPDLDLASQPGVRPAALQRPDAQDKVMENPMAVPAGRQPLAESKARKNPRPQPGDSMMAIKAGEPDVKDSLPRENKGKPDSNSVRGPEVGVRQIERQPDSEPLPVEPTRRNITYPPPPLISKSHAINNPSANQLIQSAPQQTGGLDSKHKDDSSNDGSGPGVPETPALEGGFEEKYQGMWDRMSDDQKVDFWDRLDMREKMHHADLYDEVMAIKNGEADALSEIQADTEEVHTEAPQAPTEIKEDAGGDGGEDLIDVLSKARSGVEEAIEHPVEAVSKVADKRVIAPAKKAGADLVGGLGGQREKKEEVVGEESHYTPEGPAGTYIDLNAAAFVKDGKVWELKEKKVPRMGFQEWMGKKYKDSHGWLGSVIHTALDAISPQEDEMFTPNDKDMGEYLKSPEAKGRTVDWEQVPGYTIERINGKSYAVKNGTAFRAIARPDAHGPPPKTLYDLGNLRGNGNGTYNISALRETARDMNKQGLASMGQDFMDVVNVPAATDIKGAGADGPPKQQELDEQGSLNPSQYHEPADVDMKHQERGQEDYEDYDPDKPNFTPRPSIGNTPNQIHGRGPQDFRGGPGDDTRAGQDAKNQTYQGNLESKLQVGEFGEQAKRNDGMLRPEFMEGGATFVDEVNRDVKLNMINEMVWQSFKNYQWECNEQGDNPFYQGLLGEKGVRFSGQLYGDEYLAGQAAGASVITRRTDKELSATRVPPVNKRVGRSLFMAVQPYEGQAAKSDTYQTGIKTGAETNSEFHDVFLPDWFSVDSKNPLEKFTECDGTQFPDSARLHGLDMSLHDDDTLQNVNNWIATTTS